MDISVSRLLDKIGDELSEAKKVSSEAKIRERAYAMKAICELILEESTHSRSTNEWTSQEQVIVSPPPVREPIQVPQVVQIPQAPLQNRLKTEDGANGESLFDF
jgi:Family of unknown function (DUF5327)